MGKKDKGDKAKLDAKKARQLAKQDKASSKRSKKELKQSGELEQTMVTARAVNCCYK